MHESPCANRLQHRRVQDSRHASSARDTQCGHARRGFGQRAGAAAAHGVEHNVLSSGGMATIDRSTSTVALADLESHAALGAGVALLVGGMWRRSLVGVCMAATAAPLLYRGATGRWPAGVARLFPRDTRVALAGRRGVHVRESIRLEVPVDVVYRHWRQLEQLPRIMSHLTRVTDLGNGRSRWVAEGPAGVSVEWDAEIVNEVEHHVLAWRSLPAADVVTAGSVTFRPGRGGRDTQLTVTLQYEPPAGRAGAAIATLFGREPSQTIREDLRRFKSVLETGETPAATAPEEE